MTKFNLGEKTGKKVNSAVVAKTMMTTRDDNGERLFTSEEFLTAQQVSSFFSRLAAKKRLPDLNQDDDDAFAAENESDLQVLEEIVAQEVSLQHPIIYNFHNVCDLITNSKMKKFTVLVLRQMCIYFDIDVSDIQVKMKQPYIDKLTALVQQCSCSA